MKRLAEMLMPRAKKTSHEQFLCPITHALMVNPVQASDGWTYEFNAIARWCETHETSPLDPSIFIDISHLKPNRTLRDAIKIMVDSGDIDESVAYEWKASSSNHESAAQLFRDGRIEEAAALDYPAAMGELASRYYSGRGVMQDVKVALQWAHKASMAGNGEGQFRMGYAFQMGEERPKNWTLSIKFYTMAYYNGLGAAAANISEMYRSGGFGVEKNASKMAEWCGRSSSTSSIHLLAMCYYNGDGIPVNHAEARRNFKASSANVESLYMLGRMLLRGEGGRVNLVEGIKLIEQASKRGHAKSIQLKERMLESIE
jgi:hypothetical protein